MMARHQTTPTIRRLPGACFRAAAALGLLVLFTGIAVAQHVRAFVTEDSVSVGDRFGLVLAVEHEGELNPLFPDSVVFGQTTYGDLEAFSVRGRGYRMKDVSISDVRVDSVWIEVTTFALDTAFVPPIPIRVAYGTDTLVASTAAFLVPVRRLVEENAPDVRDITPLVEFPRWILPWLLGLLAALLVASLVVYLLRRRRPVPVSLPPPVQGTPEPYDVALKRLKILERSNLEDERVVKPYFDELSGTLRTYLSDALHIHAQEETTSEIVRDLRIRADSLLREVADEAPDRVEHLLQLADLVKFADYIPGPDRSREALGETRDTIDLLERSARRQRQVEFGLSESGAER